MPSEEVIFKDRGSKFLGYAYPLQCEEEVKYLVDTLKKEHHKARHWCYAWQLGTEEVHYRVNDDGEPNNSAGQPIYGQILSKGLTNVLVVVVRYFGGVKLGVGGLVNAYKTVAQMALEASVIVEKTIDVRFKVVFGYPDMNRVMRIVKEHNLNIVEQKIEMRCDLVVSIRKSEVDKIWTVLNGLQGIEVSKL